MQLSFEGQMVDDVAVIRCKGRLTFGPEAEALEAEIERFTRIAGTSIYATRRVVLQLGETQFVDSAGLGTLVRLYGVLRAAGGGLKLCQLSPNVFRVIEVTNLRTLFPPYESEKDAIDAFFAVAPDPDESGDKSTIRIVCVDPSTDVLAGLSALLRRPGYEVAATRYVSEAVTLANAIKPRLLICGPGMPAVPTAAGIIDHLRQNYKELEVLQLPPDFHTAEAGQAAQDLLSRLRSLFER